jgi:hypothetical protein
MTRPNPFAQMRSLPLTVTPGLNGYRLAYAGGPTFEVVEEYPTFGEAWAALKLLNGLRDALNGATGSLSDRRAAA